ncbi:hypothetical protein ACOMHN_023159 [Nucella lapillus]
MKEPPATPRERRFQRCRKVRSFTPRGSLTVAELMDTWGGQDGWPALQGRLAVGRMDCYTARTADDNALLSNPINDDCIPVHRGGHTRTVDRLFQSM